MTLYALRHSSIVRALLRHVPIRVVAASHDTSVAQIERCYSKHITDHSDDVSRAALLEISRRPPPTISFRSPGADHGGSRHHDHTCKPRMGFAERGLSSRAGAKRVAGSRQDQHRYRAPERSTALALYVARVQGAA